MTKAANPTQNLVQDNKSGVWNARWFVTVDGKKKERRKSLGTKNLAEARKHGVGVTFTYHIGGRLIPVPSGGLQPPLPEPDWQLSPHPALQCVPSHFRL